MSQIIERLDKQFKELKLKGLIPVYRAIVEEASKNKLDYLEFLSILLEEEIQRKRQGSVRAKIAKARFPFMKTIEAFDFSYQPGLNEKEVLRLASLEFIDKKDNLIFLGPPGVGKTHLAVALGVKACREKYRVIFLAASDLLKELKLALKGGILTDRLLYYSRLDLLIIDEVGYLKINQEESNLLFQLISMRYEKGSIILTSNYNFDDWGKVFEDSVVASAIIDRLIHHSHIFFINGASYRLKNKLAKISSERGGQF